MDDSETLYTIITVKEENPVHTGEMTSPVSSPPFLDDTTVSAHLPWRPLVDAVERSMADYSRQDGSVAQPVRSSFFLPQRDRWFGSMSAYSKSADVIATKLVTSFTSNVTCPKIQSTIMLHSPENGSLLALMSAECVTARRTAAASVAASKHLASSCRVLAIVGSGVQARSHAEAFVAADCGVEEVRISARNTAAAADLVTSLAKDHPGVRFVHCESTQQCVDGADVINTTTASPDPVLMDAWVASKGVHINAVGGRVPHKTELEPALLRRATVYTDSREGAAGESGPVSVAIYGEVGEVVNGAVPAKKDGVTVFLSFGMAVEDAVAARLVWDSYQLSASK